MLGSGLPTSTLLHLFSSILTFTLCSQVSHHPVTIFLLCLLARFLIPSTGTQRGPLNLMQLQTPLTIKKRPGLYQTNFDYWDRLKCGYFLHLLCFSFVCSMHKILGWSPYKINSKKKRKKRGNYVCEQLSAPVLTLFALIITCRACGNLFG